MVEDIIVPNSEFTGGRVINWTQGERMRRLHVPFSVAYGYDKHLAKETCIYVRERLRLQ